MCRDHVALTSTARSHFERFLVFSWSTKQGNALLAQHLAMSPTSRFIPFPLGEATLGKPMTHGPSWLDQRVFEPCPFCRVENHCRICLVGATPQELLAGGRSLRMSKALGTIPSPFISGTPKKAWLNWGLKNLLGIICAYRKCVSCHFFGGCNKRGQTEIEFSFQPGDFIDVHVTNF